MPMSNAEAAQALADHRPPEAIVISTMTTLRTFPAMSPSDLNLSCVPLMGGASALGLGVALAQPDRTVIVLDGDGSLLMQLGSLATVAGAAPSNLHHVLFDNGVWFEGGANLPLPAAGRLDWAAMAAAAGYPEVHDVATVDELRSGLPLWWTSAGPRFIRLAIDSAGTDRSPWSGDNPQGETPDRQFTRMGEEARRIRARLVDA